MSLSWNRALPDEEEIASSYAHALARAGQPAHARAVLKSAFGGHSSKVDQTLSAWLKADPVGTAQATRAGSL